MTPERLAHIADMAADERTQFFRIDRRSGDILPANHIIRELLAEIDRLSGSVVLRVGDDTYAWPATSARG